MDLNSKRLVEFLGGLRALGDNPNDIILGGTAILQVVTDSFINVSDIDVFVRNMNWKQRRYVEHIMNLTGGSKKMLGSYSAYSSHASSVGYIPLDSDVLVNVVELESDRNEKTTRVLMGYGNSIAVNVFLPSEIIKVKKSFDREKDKKFFKRYKNVIFGKLKYNSILMQKTPLPF